MNLYIEKKCKNWKNIKKTEGFQCLHAPIILTDSIYRKGENYYPKVFSEKILFYERYKLFVVILMWNVMIKNA